MRTSVYAAQPGAAGAEAEAVLAIWSTTPADTLADFRAWHNEEHLPERIALPGFVRARRFVSCEQPGRFFAWYDVERLEDLESEAYRACVDAPSAWTMRILSRQIDPARGLFRKRFSAVRAGGGLVAVWRLETSPSDGPGIEALCAALPNLAAQPAVAAVHLLVAAEEMSAVGSAATNALVGVQTPALVLVAEGWSDADDLRAVSARCSLSGILELGGAVEVYRLEAMMQAR